MADAPSFAKLVPGFEFLEGLSRNAGAALPNIGQWIAPTLDPDEIEKRIEELRTVQFWLEQNARMLAATIQALEVQRMTLSTLKTMNVQMEDLRDSLQVRLPTVTAASMAASPKQAPAPPAGDATTKPPPAAAPKHSAAKESGTASAGAGRGPVDPLQWWGALTQQFTKLATQAMQESAGEGAQRATEAARCASKSTSPRGDVPKEKKKTASRRKRASSDPTA